MVQKVINGNDAVAHAVRLSRVQVVPSYPITPQTGVVETLADMWADGSFTGQYVAVDSENSSMAYCIGAAYAGARAFTATSSHGLAYMHELLHWAAGARLPLVLSNANRALGAPWCIETDQLDSLSQRDTGWIQLYCSSVQEILDTVIIAFRLAEEARLPVMVVYDGFYLSHTSEAVHIPSQETVDGFLPGLPAKPAFDLDNPENYHGVVNSELMARLQNVRYNATAAAGTLYDILSKIYGGLTGRFYPAVEYFGPPEAGTLFVTAGSMAQTVKSFVQSPEQKESLVRIKQFRPFPAEEMRGILARPEVRRIVVIDRNSSMGSGGIFAQETRAALYGAGHVPEMAELNLSGGMDLTPEILSQALSMSRKNEKMMWAVNF